jgi:hypothetical protein
MDGTTTFVTRLAIVCAAILVPGELRAALVTTGPVEWSVADGGNGHWYALVMPETQSEGVTWTQAKLLAEATTFLGSQGHLITVTSAGENDFLGTNFSSLIRPNGSGFVGDAAWIGLSDMVQEGNYQWVTGEAFTYSNWYVTEPNNLGNEDFAHYWVRNGEFSWNDAQDNVFGGFPGQLQGYFVEFDGPFVQPVPEPGSCLLWTSLAIAGVGYTRWRRRFLA